VPRYLVERTYPEGFEIPANADSAPMRMKIIGANEQENVTWIHSYVSIDKRKLFCIYEGPTPEAVRLAAAENSLPIDRITEVRILDPYPYS
jgi:hypothetical protein